MKLEEINNRTKDAVNHLVEALESGQSEVLTEYLSAMARFHNSIFFPVLGSVLFIRSVTCLWRDFPARPIVPSEIALNAVRLAAVRSLQKNHPLRP